MDAARVEKLFSGQPVVLKKDADLELVEAGMVLGLGLLVSFAVPLLGSAFRGALFTAAVGGLLLAGVVYAFERYGLWLNLTYPGLAVLVTYLVVAVAQSVLVERARRQMRRGPACSETIKAMLLCSHDERSERVLQCGASSERRAPRNHQLRWQLLGGVPRV